MIQPYSRRDDARTVAFLEAAARADTNLQAPTPEEWRGYVGRSANEDGRDFALVEHEGTMIALLMSCREEEQDKKLRNFRIIVAPKHRCRGIGAALLEHVAARDEDRTLQASCLRTWTEGVRFLERHGFRPERNVLWFVLDLASATSARDGACEIISYTGAEDAAWQRLHDQGYKGGPDYSPLFEKDLACMREEPGFRLRFAVDAGEPIGLCHVKQYNRRNYINSLVVAPQRRGEGIGRALMVDMLNALRADRVDTVRLTVLERNEHAAQLYRALGFRDENASTTFWR